MMDRRELYPGQRIIILTIAGFWRAMLDQETKLQGGDSQRDAVLRSKDNQVQL